MVTFGFTFSDATSIRMERNDTCLIECSTCATRVLTFAINMEVEMIVVAGAAHLDRLGRTERPAVADTSNPGSFQNTLGGAALNVASSLATLGEDVTLVSCVGDDVTGRDVIDGLAARGVATQISTLPDQNTATYTAIVSNNGDLMIGLADMACYAQFDPTNAAQSLAALKSSDWLLVDANLPSSAIETAVDMVECKIAAMTVSSAKAKNLRPILGKIDTLFTNTSEVKALTGLRGKVSTADMIAGLQKLDVTSAVITNKAQNVLVFDGDQYSEISVPPSPTADVTGAGDGLVAGCLFELMAGKSLNDAVKTGICVAQAILQVTGPYLPHLKSKLTVSKDI